MTCYRPLEAWRSYGERTEAGKNAIVFSPPPGPSQALRLPCGQCIGCRVTKSLEWATRCVHEASLYDENCVITLTYDDHHLPETGSLVKRDYQTFIKRLRARSEHRIRYFLCGEYGDESGRPHYHAILFGHDFADKIPFGKFWVSQTLLELWPKGQHCIDEMSWHAAAYIARYCIKKLNGEKAIDRYVSNINESTGECEILEPEFIAMSKGRGNGGIGKGWYEKYGRDCRKNFLTDGQKRVKIPTYYDKLIRDDEPAFFETLKRERTRRARETTHSRKRLAAMERCQTLVMKRKERCI